MEPFLSSNESDCHTSSIEPNPKRRRIHNDIDEQQQQQPPLTHHHHHHHDDHNQNASFQPTKRWRTETEQQIYSSKLLQAIRHVRRTNTGRSREIRETADRVLAVSAKGTTRWSRAILANPLSLRLKTRHVKVKTSYSRLRRKAESKAKMKAKAKAKAEAKTEKRRKLPAVQRKLRVLSRLIPGCQQLSGLNLLEEATDYIAALEMQVRAMTALTEILAGAPPVENQLGSNFSS